MNFHQLTFFLQTFFQRVEMRAFIVFRKGEGVGETDIVIS
jgi:hypothetical protein